MGIRRLITALPVLAMMLSAGPYTGPAVAAASTAPPPTVTINSVWWTVAWPGACRLSATVTATNVPAGSLALFAYPYDPTGALYPGQMWTVPSKAVTFTTTFLWDITDASRVYSGVSAQLGFLRNGRLVAGPVLHAFDDGTSKSCTA